MLYNLTHLHHSAEPRVLYLTIRDGHTSTKSRNHHSSLGCSKRNMKFLKKFHRDTLCPSTVDRYAEPRGSECFWNSSFNLCWMSRHEVVMFLPLLLHPLSREKKERCSFLKITMHHHILRCWNSISRESCPNFLNWSSIRKNVPVKNIAQAGLSPSSTS